jgi:hypothetical protein
MTMPASHPVSPWADWRPDDYVQDYYGAEIQPDEREAIRFQVEFLRRSGRVFPRALEYGCGPTLMRAIAAAGYVESLDMAEYLESNLARVRRWAAGGRDADDWGAFTRYVLQCEGLAEPEPADVRAREARTREVVADLLPTDARQPHPLGGHRDGSYDLLITGFCVEGVSESKEVWRSSLGNVLTLLKGGGSFVLAAVRRCNGYRVGGHWFPAADIDLSDLGPALLECGCDPASLRLEERDLPSHDSQGYQGILLAAGRKRA